MYFCPRKQEETFRKKFAGIQPAFQSLAFNGASHHSIQLKKSKRNDQKQLHVNCKLMKLKGLYYFLSQIQNSVITLIAFDHGYAYFSTTQRRDGKILLL